MLLKTSCCCSFENKTENLPWNTNAELPSCSRAAGTTSVQELPFVLLLQEGTYQLKKSLLGNPYFFLPAYWSRFVRTLTCPTLPGTCSPYCHKRERKAKGWLPYWCKWAYKIKVLIKYSTYLQVLKDSRCLPVPFLGAFCSKFQFTIFHLPFYQRP